MTHAALKNRIATTVASQRHAAVPESQPRYHAAVIGLGDIGSQWDDDPKATEIQSHAGAYRAVSAIELVAGVDSDADRLRRFIQQRGSVKGYRDYHTLFRSEAIYLLSICLPALHHHKMVLEGVKAGVKAIFCERPIAATLEEATEIVETCESAGVVLAVNHTRRWDAVYIRAKRLVARGEIGSLTSLVGYYPGRVFTMGTHLFDLMRFFAGNVEWVSGDATDRGEGELNISGLLHFKSGVKGTVVAGMGSPNHLFELDLLGSRGRLRISGDGTRLELSRFEDSPNNAAGYREPATVLQEETAKTGRPLALVAAVADLLACAQGGGTPACSGRDGMAALEIAWALCESATRGHRRIDLPLYRSLYGWRG